MNRKIVLGLLALLLGAALPGCLGPGPAEDSVATPLPSPAQHTLLGLLEYVPAAWILDPPADPYPLYPPVYFLDLARMEENLGLPEVSGADSRQAKLDLITGINSQGFILVGYGIDPTSSAAFEAWGWDVADIEQALHIPSRDASILRGDFGRPEIRARLLEKGYREEVLEAYTLFLQTEQPQFALKEDTLIISTDEATITDLIGQKANRERSLAEQASVVQLATKPQQPWGFFLAPVGELPIDECEAGWDLMMAAFWGEEETTALHLLYHYPSKQEARQDIDLVEIFLTQAPSIRHPGSTWDSLVSLESVDVEENVLVAQVSTTTPAFLGRALGSEDYWGLIPVRGCFPKGER